LSGGHVIMLGPGNEEAAREALGCHPGNLQVGGGINPDNAVVWLDAGADKVIVTSYLFSDGALDMEKVRRISEAVGRDRLVIDLSCVWADDAYHVATNRWQTICEYTLDAESIGCLADYCAEFLVHAVGVEGKQGGIDARLVSLLADWSPIPVTYAGGIRNLDDIDEIRRAGKEQVDFTVGSALDIFGGPLSYTDVCLCARE
ncbi:MAG: phosphoribosylformimino-5-aminoimidazole carboxamide ribotide isomerase, partial [Victivallales bacterium]|nr:phosphoribosylformimino-5-aminoimidazole carboxamide ribotide isomerase [Victivallales bacterium]